MSCERANPLAKAQPMRLEGRTWQQQKPAKKWNPNPAPDLALRLVKETNWEQLKSLGASPTA